MGGGGQVTERVLFLGKHFVSMRVGMSILPLLETEVRHFVLSHALLRPLHYLEKLFLAISKLDATRNHLHCPSWQGVLYNTCVVKGFSSRA